MFLPPIPKPPMPCTPGPVQIIKKIIDIICKKI
jgi:hypothetical protein